jgi:CubicO group peptidase (beta-lactamase class C family)
MSLWLVALALAWCPSPAIARIVQSEAARRDVRLESEQFGDAARLAESHLARMRETFGPPGISAAVALYGESVWSAALGLADVAADRPMTRETCSRIGSVSKALTGIALGRLLERGEIELGASVQHYLPEFPVHEPPMTVRQLACHQAGLRHYQGLEFMSREPCARIADAFAVFADDPLVSPPGSAYHYSSYGFSVLSAVMEAAARRPFLELMQREVFDPAGLSRTGPEAAGRDAGPRATAYVSLDGGPPVVAPAVDLSCKWAGGGFLSTPLDLVRAGCAMLDGRLLSPAAFERVATPQPLEDGSPSGSGYGLGWRSGSLALPGSGRQVHAVHHSGVALGGAAFLLLLPEEGLVIAVCHNLYQPKASGDFQREVLALAEVFLSAR